MADAQARIAKATAAAGQWDGPTTGPKAAAGKTIIYVAGDMRNGGTEGVSRGVEEAAKAIGWTVRILDGRGDISARTAALEPGDRAEARRASWWAASTPSSRMRRSTG